MRTYDELAMLGTFEERFMYLRLDGAVGKETFGYERYLNQQFYKSREWKTIRDAVIIRDNGCDLGIADRSICGKIFVHHMNPVTSRDIKLCSDALLDLRYLICVSFETHNAIHYGDASLLITVPAKREKNDTCPWRH